jgi:hypothetical protein
MQNALMVEDDAREVTALNPFATRPVRLRGSKHTAFPHVLVYHGHLASNILRNMKMHGSLMILHTHEMHLAA